MLWNKGASIFYRLFPTDILSGNMSEAGRIEVGQNVHGT